MIGLRQQVRAGVATVLAGTASVLQMAAGVAETVAQELRLTLPSDDGDTATEATRVAGAPEAPAGPRAWSTGAGMGGPSAPAPPTAPDAPPARPGGRPLTDVTAGRDVSARGDSGPATAPDVGAGPASEGEPLPRPRAATASADGPAGDEPPPWVDDVAESVAGGTVREATARLPELSAPQLRAVERYERSHAGRVTLLRAIDTELALRDEAGHG